MSLNYVIRANKFKAKKSLGQNFLVDAQTIDFISDFVDETDTVLEIGAGLGFVTEQIVKKARSVTAVEIDKDAISVLKNNLSDFDNFKLIEQDILKTDISKLGFNEKIKVIGNIPYYITSPIIAHLLGEIDDVNNKNRNSIKEILLMVQLEVAKRICAGSNSKGKEYGSLSILSQMNSEVEIVKVVPKKSFQPSPKVDSALVKFKIRHTPLVKPTRLLRGVVRALFNQRRKNIKNSLQNGGFLEVQKTLDNLNIASTLRAENLSIEEISKIALALEEFN